MKIICNRCGKDYDIDEWAGCPHCARDRYKQRPPRQWESIWPYKNKIIWC